MKRPLIAYQAPCYSALNALNRVTFLLKYVYRNQSERLIYAFDQFQSSSWSELGLDWDGVIIEALRLFIKASKVQDSTHMDQAQR